MGRTLDGGLPPAFLRHIEGLEAAYLRYDDLIRQSGFSGGAERWRAERGPVLDAIESGGDLLDQLECANGYLLKCLLQWGSERGLRLVPHGLDIGSRLIELAKERVCRSTRIISMWAMRGTGSRNGSIGMCICSTTAFRLTTLAEGVSRLLGRVVAPEGRLILGAYGSKSDFDTAV